jgi:repressor of nif and glnA expression
MTVGTTDGVQLAVNERDRQVLAYLDRVDLALPPSVLYHNLDADEGVTFSERTLKRRLAVLDELGLTESVPGTDGYRRITPAGREYTEGES